METLLNLLHGLSIAAEPLNLLLCFGGVVAGVFIGALPGLGPSAGLAILLPLTFGMNPTAGIIFMAGIYYGAMYGGSITSILIGVPGDSASVMTVSDGYPLAKAGRAGAALGMAMFASFIGGTASVLALTLVAPVLARVALSFGPPEYFALMLLGLTAVSGLTGTSVVKGLLSTLVGLFISVIGLDLVTGLPRFTFGTLRLFEGVDFIVVALGLFGVAEILMSMEDKEVPLVYEREQLQWRKLFPTVHDWAVSKWHIATGSVMGFFIGTLPGAGATIATFIVYGMAKSSASPERKALFGNGAIEGVAAPEAANNAASAGAMVPLLTLGVPGSASTAIMMGALMMFGLRPGPLLFQNNADFVWGLIGSMYIGNLILMLLMMVCIPLFVRMLKTPKPILNAVVMAFIIVGAYSLNNSMFDVGLTILFGFLGYAMKKMDYPVAPLILALVLGKLLENSLRQSLIISGGSISIFFVKPIAGVLMVCALGAIVWPMIKALRGTKENVADSA